MKKTLLKTILLLTLTIYCMASQAQQTAHKVIFEQMNYLLYLPDGYDATDSITKWPMMIFLHGASNEGSDLKTMKLEGPPQKIDQGYKYPFIVVSPQSPQNGWRTHHVYNLAERMQEELHVDSDRMYLTGLSMGGFGTWNTAMSHPNYFAAIVPICGGAHYDNTHTLEHTPIWCFHGEKDDVVSIDYSYKAMEAVKHFNNENQKLTTYPEGGHDCWRETYDNPQIYEWMLSHTRYKYKEVTIAPELLQEYAGSYIMEDRKMTMGTEDNQLFMLIDDEHKIAYTPMSDSKFFFSDDQYQYIEFQRNEEGKVFALKYQHPHGDSVYLRQE